MKAVGDIVYGINITCNNWIDSLSQLHTALQENCELTVTWHISCHQYVGNDILVRQCWYSLQQFLRGMWAACRPMCCRHVGPTNICLSFRPLFWNEKIRHTQLSLMWKGEAVWGGFSLNHDLTTSFWLHKWPRTPQSEPSSVCITAWGYCHMLLDSISMCSNILYISMKYAINSLSWWLLASTMT